MISKDERNNIGIAVVCISTAIAISAINLTLLSQSLLKRYFKISINDRGLLEERSMKALIREIVSFLVLIVDAASFSK
ncbi:hypothetical protein [Altericista sp. CCNU0014]|uniref:hypothetical protein n=1 Tax=Altericista sp. CCNU0014 TaxID=3082949 RepID=UPI00384F2502